MARLPQKKHAPVSVDWIVDRRDDRDARVAHNIQTRHKVGLVLLLAFIVGAGSIQWVPSADPTDPIAAHAAVAQGTAVACELHHNLATTHSGGTEPDASRRAISVSASGVSASSVSLPNTNSPRPPVPTRDGLDDATLATLAAVPHTR